MVFNFKRKTIIIASVVCIGVCGAIGGTVAGIYCTGQYTVSDMQTESLSQSTSAESIQESAGESNVEESVQSQTTESQTSETQSSDSQTEAATLNTETDTVAENGDKVNIDYTGYMDGEKFEGGSTDGQGTDLVLGSGSYIDGFEDGVVGHKVGETFDLNLKFPDDYKVNTELAGKDVTFEVTLNGVYK